MIGLTIRDPAYLADEVEVTPTADWYVDVRDYDGVGALFDQGPNKYHLRVGLGVVQLVPGRTGTKLMVAGSGGGTVTVATTVPAPTTSMEVMQQVGPYDQNHLMSNYASASNWGFQFYLSSQRLAFSVRQTDGTAVAVQSTVTFNVAEGEYLKAYWDLVTDFVTFSRSPDGVTWTAIGTPVAFNPTSFTAATAATAIASRGNSGWASGDVYRSKVTIDGTPRIDVDFTTQTVNALTFTPTVGGTVTITPGANATGANRPPFLVPDPSFGAYVYFQNTTAEYVSKSVSTSRTILNKFRLTAFLSPKPNLGALTQCIGGDTTGASNPCVGGMVYTNTAGTTSTLWTGFGAGLLTSGAQTHTIRTLAMGGWFRWTTDKNTLTMSCDSSVDGVSWSTEWSTSFVFQGNTSPISSTPYIGRVPYTTANPYWGGIGRFQIEEDNVLIYDFDANEFNSDKTVSVDSLGNTWLLTRAPTGHKTPVVDRPILLHNGNQWMSMPANPMFNIVPGESKTLLIACRVHDTGTVAYAGLGAYASQGWGLQPGAYIRRPNADLATITSADYPKGVVSVVTAQLTSVGAQTWIVKGYINGILVGQDNTPANQTGGAYNLDFFIGRAGTASTFSVMEFLGAALLIRTPTLSEIVKIGQEFETL